MNRVYEIVFCWFVIFFSVLHGCDVPQEKLATQSETPEEFWEFTNSIPRIMLENNIPGFSIAVVNKDSILLAQSFGVLARGSQRTVNNETIFSLQSISKTITATAVMFAAQEGLVALDTPIVRYLPEFRVGSRFNEHPERIITLRHLLSHRAGFTHEAPIGNNFQVQFDSFEQHIFSILDTWLKAPVGMGPIYSNLGVDLAGYILQVQSGMPFAQYVESRLFEPLGMGRSSFDWKTIRSDTNLAIGHNRNFRKIPLEYAMIPSGACYTNVLDMAKFLMFHLNKGRVQNEILLEEKYLEEMFTIPFSEDEYGLGLGIEVYERNGRKCFRHGGGGFGFLTSLQWCPDYNIGIVVLTNSVDHDNVQWQVAEDIINKVRREELASGQISTDEITPKQREVIELSRELYETYSGVYVMPSGDETVEILYNGSQFGGLGRGRFIPFLFYSNDEFSIEGFGPTYDGLYQIVIDQRTKTPLYINHLGYGIVFWFNEKFNSPPGPNNPEWQKFVGEYAIKVYGKTVAAAEISVNNGYLYYNKLRLQEYIPGVFYAPNGEVLDLRKDIPTFRNIKLFRK